MSEETHAAARWPHGITTSRNVAGLLPGYGRVVDSGRPLLWHYIFDCSEGSTQYTCSWRNALTEIPPKLSCQGRFSRLASAHYTHLSSPTLGTSDTAIDRSPVKGSHECRYIFLEYDCAHEYSQHCPFRDCAVSVSLLWSHVCRTLCAVHAWLVYPHSLREAQF